MLYLISLGLGDEKGMSLRALETAKKCDSLYAEFYTNKTAATATSLSKIVCKKVIELERTGMEEGYGNLIKEAEKKDVGIFVPGDALSATTHLMLLSEAKRADVRVRVIHGSSIFTATAETGLQLYKFGRAVTLTNPVEKSTLRAIEQNLKNGLHTLVLLDIGMDAVEGLGLIKGFLKGRKVAVACGLGGDDALIRYGAVEGLLGDKELHKGLKGRMPAIIAIPGRLHFTEEEFLEGLTH